MDNYLLMGHILQCKVIPKDKVHPDLWVGANRKWRQVPRDRIVRVQHHKVGPVSIIEAKRLTMCPRLGLRKAYEKQRSG